MPGDPNRLERLMSLVAPVRGGEGRVVLLMFAYGFTLMFSYYLVKPVREALILAEASAEVRSYAVALQALVLVAFIPVYTAIFRRIFPHYHLVKWITAFLALNLPVFTLLAWSGVSVGVEFFIWLGVFNVLIVAQFWALAADLFSIEAGERLFVLIAAGISLGAWLGAVTSNALFPLLGPYGLMMLTMVLLLATIPAVPLARAWVPDASRPATSATEAEVQSGFWGGLKLVLADSYLRLIAGFVLLLNCINSTGEYLLARLVREHAADLVAAGVISDVGTWIGGFYGSFYAWVSFLGLAVQLLLVSRIFRLVGVSGALLVLPVVAAVGYGLLVFVPVFALMRVVKLGENSINYSLQNTARHALMLPLDEESKYAGKTTIDTLFWRVGDMVQAGIVFVGVTWVAASPAGFALFNFGLSLLWLVIAAGIGGRYRRLAESPAVAPAAVPG